MKKRHIILSCVVVLFLILLGASMFLLKQKQDFKLSIADIPEFCLQQATDSLPFCNTQLAKGLPIVLMYLHPECEVCHTEARQMQQKACNAENIQWVLISYANRDSLNKFATIFHLHDIPRLTILMDSQLTLHSRLQVKSIPSCYIYNSQHQLVKVIQGMGRVEKIIQLANR